MNVRDIWKPLRLLCCLLCKAASVAISQLPAQFLILDLGIKIFPSRKDGEAWLMLLDFHKPPRNGCNIGIAQDMTTF